MKDMVPVGRDVIVWLRGCEDIYINKPMELSKVVYKASKEAGLTPFPPAIKEFGRGITILIPLMECHLAVHTWPTYDNLIKLDVSVCDYEKDNGHMAMSAITNIAKVLGAKKVKQFINNWQWHVVFVSDVSMGKGDSDFVQEEDVC